MGSNPQAYIIRRHLAVGGNFGRSFYKNSKMPLQGLSGVSVCNAITELRGFPSAAS